MTKRVLEKKGHIVESASNGSLGLSMLMETHGTGSDFDLVLCDFQMPVMDGFEAVPRYRAYERDAKLVRPDAAAATRSRPNMAIVGMSASSDLASMALARQVGMNAVMTKPFSIANLQGMLNLFLQ
jgi:CheY-like chemotaxis protein